MDKVRPIDMVDYDPDSFVAIGVLAGKHSNVRMIRLCPGTSLPPHTHGESELFLYATEGGGELDTADGVVPLQAGDLAHYRGDEELRVRNNSTVGLTLLAFLAPAFPPAAATDVA